MDTSKIAKYTKAAKRQMWGVEERVLKNNFDRPVGYLIILLEELCHGSGRRYQKLNKCTKNTWSEYLG